jgi:hypothetical protein
MKYTREQLNRLNPKQLAIVERFEKNAEAQYKTFQQAFSTEDPDERDRLIGELGSHTACPHGHHVTCMACDEIEKLLWPEHVCMRCDYMIDPDDTNKLDSNRVCDECRVSAV